MFTLFLMFLSGYSVNKRSNVTPFVSFVPYVVKLKNCII